MNLSVSVCTICIGTGHVAPPTWLRNDQKINCQLSSILNSHQQTKVRCSSNAIILTFLLPKRKKKYLSIRIHLVSLSLSACTTTSNSFPSSLSVLPLLLLLLLHLSPPTTLVQDLTDYVRHVACSIFVPVQGTGMIGRNILSFCMGSLSFRPVSSR